MSTDTIAAYLVSLGFKVDEAGLRRFSDQVGHAGELATKFAGAVEAAAVVVEAAVVKMASGLDALFFSSARTGAAVENIEALGYAASQTGSSVGAARSSLEGLASFLRNNPGGEGFLKGLGVTSHDAAIQVQQLGAAFRNMPTYLAHTYASMLGIDDRTALAMRSGDFDRQAEEHRQRLRAAGLDEQQAASSANALMTQWRGLEDTFRVLGDLVYSKLTGATGNAIKQFRVAIEGHFKEIAAFVTNVATVVLKAADMVTELVMSVGRGINEIIDVFSGLDSHSRGLIETFGAIVVAWMALNSSFALSPIGLVIELGAGLALLWQDYETWRDGGSSLIDWGKWEPGIERAKEAIAWIGEHIDGLAQAVGGWQSVLEGLAAFVAASWATRMIAAFGRVGASFLAISTSMAGSSLGKLLGMAEGAGVAGLAIGADQLEKAIAPETQEREANWENRNIPGASVLEDFTARHLGWGRTYEQQAESQSRQDGTPRGIRNNNPGNLNFVGQAGARIEGGPNGRFAVFESMHDGIVALANQLQLYAGRGIDTVSGIINKYAPGFENNTGSYINSIIRDTGLDPNAHLDLRNPGTLHALMKAITSVEVGKGRVTDAMIDDGIGRPAVDPNSPQGQMQLRLDQFRRSNLFQPQGYRDPGGSGSGGGAPVINQTTHINVQGGGDPQATAAEVARQQDSVNQRIVRHLGAMAY